MPKFLAALTIGLFLILPLYFKSLGWNEVVFGQIYLIGIVGTICSILSGIKLMHKVGFRKIAPIGNLLCVVSCLLYLAGTIDQSISCYYLASLLQGAQDGDDHLLQDQLVLLVPCQKKIMPSAFIFLLYILL